MSKTSDGAKQNTKKLRFTLLSAFFNFVKNSLDPQFNNPCDNPQLRNFSGAGKAVPLKILEKDAVDEIIFQNPEYTKPVDSRTYGSKLYAYWGGPETHAF
jgi:integrase/recombinase XerD